MIVSIISEESHAKPLVLALKKDGHTVNHLGGNAGLTVPSTTELLICRTASCSHGAFNTAIAAKRGGLETIIANGTTEIMNSLRAYVAKNNGVQTQAPVLPPLGTMLSKPLTVTARALAAIPQLVALLGAYGPLLHVQSAGPVVEWMATRRGEKGAQGLELWKKTLGIDIKTIREVTKTLRANAGTGPCAYTVQEAYLTSWMGGPKLTYLLVSDKSIMDGLYSRLDIAGTSEAAQIKVDAKRSENIALTNAKNAASRAVQAPTPAPVAVPKADTQVLDDLWKDLEGALADSTVGLLAVGHVPKQPLSAPNPAPVPTPVVEAAPVLKSAAWDADLRVALGMLRAEMRKTGVQKVTIGLDGAFSFEREIKIIDHVSGGLGADE